MTVYYMAQKLDKDSFWQPLIALTKTPDLPAFWSDEDINQFQEK